MLALIDANSFLRQAFFRKTFIGNFQKGDRAVVTLMSYPDTPLDRSVDSIGWAMPSKTAAQASSSCPPSSRPSSGSGSRSAFR